MENIGLIFDDVIILKRVINKSHKRYKVKCLKCGREKEMNLCKLKKSIGTTHKACSNLVEKNEHFHRKWLSMRRRTTNPNCQRYKDYGGRGINSDVWEYFIDFYDDMYESYLIHVKKYGEKDTTLERIDVNGNYCEDNCTWVTLSEQQGNTQKNKKFKATSPDGTTYISKNQNKFAKEHGLIQSHISKCLNGKELSHRGWLFELMD